MWERKTERMMCDIVNDDDPFIVDSCSYHNHEASSSPVLDGAASAKNVSEARDEKHSYLRERSCF